MRGVVGAVFTSVATPEKQRVSVVGTDIADDWERPDGSPMYYDGCKTSCIVCNTESSGCRTSRVYSVRSSLMSTIEPPKPRFAQIADVLRDRISREVYRAGEPLPSEPELAKEFDVSRITINRAVGLLRSGGLIRVRRGLGSFVRAIPVVTRNANTRFIARDQGRGAFDVEVRSLGMKPRSEVTVDRVDASDLTAKLLGLEPGSEVVVRRRRFYADDEPVQIADSYIPATVAEEAGITEADAGPGGSFSRLAEIGRAPVNFIEDVTCRGATPSEAKFLEMESQQPVLEVLLVASDEAGVPVSMTQHVMAGHQWRLRYEWSDSEKESRNA